MIMKQMKFGRTAVFAGTLALALPACAAAQEYPRPEDVATPEAAIAAAYESIARAPGEAHDWERFRSLHLPEAILISNTEQTNGEFRVMGVEEFISWAQGYTDQVSGTDQDQGFVEAGIHNVKNEYGDVVQIMSTYEKGLHGQEPFGRGINGFTLVWNADRWWIASIAWDEENGAGPIPEQYLP